MLWTPGEVGATWYHAGQRGPCRLPAFVRCVCRESLDGQVSGAPVGRGLGACRECVGRLGLENSGDETKRLVGMDQLRRSGLV